MTCRSACHSQKEHKALMRRFPRVIPSWSVVMPLLKFSQRKLDTARQNIILIYYSLKQYYYLKEDSSKMRITFMLSGVISQIYAY